VHNQSSNDAGIIDIVHNQPIKGAEETISIEGIKCPMKKRGRGIGF
jgi:hypothetical protein